jgi:hypothetical protein
MQQTTFAPGALRVETGEGQECLDVVLDFESPGVPVVVVTNFENVSPTLVFWRTTCVSKCLQRTISAGRSRERYFSILIMAHNIGAREACVATSLGGVAKQFSVEH